MESWNHVVDQLPFYLDDELHGDERQALEQHIETCRACHTALSRERRFLENIRTARPMYQVPSSLRYRVEEIVTGKPASKVSPSRLKRRRSIYGVSGGSYQDALRAMATRIANRRRRVVFALTVAIAMLMGTVYLNRHRELLPYTRFSDLALLAVDTHLRHLRGQLPLEIVTNSPEQISQWFFGKVPFGFKLPNYQESSGQQKIYELEGARLVGFKKDYAAYVAYQMRRRPITLVITSTAAAIPSGREKVQSQGITFHYDSINGLKVMTWADRGLSYALVSDLEESAQASCMVCHAGTKDREFFQTLKSPR
ncbi:MAG TPA: zf-HC2 domain-containing protein [Blastocatellia bacterium]